MKKFFLSLLLIYLFIPIYVFAYSDYLIASGKTIGIELKSDNVMIVGSYDIGNYNVLNETNLQLGDKIIKINNTQVSSVSQMQEVINNINKDKIQLTYLRNNNLYNETIPLYKDNQVNKTGLYIKDTIRGVATLTYIDTLNHTYGALGHEIIEKNTKSKFDSSNGTIFKSTVTSVTKSSNGNPGEKNARSDSTIVYGNISENTNKGIFGNYTDTLPNTKLYKVAKIDEIKPGSAKILTVINNDLVEEFDINIIKLNTTSSTKNILFEITDQNLIERTGGIIQGMSGSPIIQDNYIIGAVNYVLVDNPSKGYGIFITNMLEEAEN